LDQFARSRLTLADLDPILDVDTELRLIDVTPQLFQTLQLLEPYGIGNPEPVFASRAVQLVAPPRVLKEKHVKLKLKTGPVPTSEDSSELSAAAILATPRCHPDSAAIRRIQRVAAVAELGASSVTNEPRTDFRTKITFDALGWHMAERLQKSPLLAGDCIDIAYSIGHNDHPEYGGLELSLRDFRALTTNGNARPSSLSPR
jgi:single-stranded-DNA-specific exonuclease